MAQVLRATFESVISNQERLRKHLDELISENRPLRDEKERELFMRELSYSTLGLGFEYVVTYYHEKTGAFIRKDVETTARWLSYQTSSDVDVPLELYSNDRTKIVVPISELWMVLRNNLFTVFPLALKTSVSMSREQDAGKKPSGYQVGDDSDG